MNGTPRARAVGDAPVEWLLERADELARRWAVALIVALPLERIGEIPLDGFAREAPPLCAQFVRALQSDAELAHLVAPPEQAPARRRPERRAAPGDGGQDHTGGEHAGHDAGEAAAQAHRLGALTGAHQRGVAAVQAVEALRGVLWEALLDALRWPSPDATAARQVADLADRLAYVCSSALVAALGADSPATVVVSSPLAEPDAAAGEFVVAQTRAPAEDEPVIIGGAVIVDEARDPSPRRAGARPWDFPLRSAEGPGPRGEPRREGFG
jgi:hypothetical protein